MAGPFSNMSDHELDDYIHRWESYAPEIFWQDGELNMSQNEAYAYYRRQWRGMSPEGQQRQLNSLMKMRMAAENQFRKLQTKELARMIEEAKSLPLNAAGQEFLKALEAEQKRRPKKRASSAQPDLISLLALLRAASQVHWTEHWQTQGLPFYGDHLMFERFYNGMIEEIDGLAEKLVFMYGAMAVDPVAQLTMMAGWATKWAQETAQVGLAGMASQVEWDIQNALENVLEKMEITGEASYGLQNFLQGVADAHETNQYLIGQRQKASSLARRYIFAGLFDQGPIGRDEESERDIHESPQASSLAWMDENEMGPQAACKSAADRELSYIQKLTLEMEQAVAAAKEAVVKARAALAKRPNWPRDAKDILIPALNRLKKANEAATIADTTSANRLRAYPTSPNFSIQHETVAKFETVWESSKLMQKAITKAAFGDANQVSQGLSAIN